MIQSGSANCPLGGSADPVADGGPVVDPGHAAPNQSLECPESFLFEKIATRSGESEGIVAVYRGDLTSLLPNSISSSVQVVHLCTAAVKAMHGTFWSLAVEVTFQKGNVSFPWRRREGMLI